MKNTYESRNLYYILVVVSMLMGGLFFITNHMDFVIVAIRNDRLHLSNISYIALRIISQLLMPATLFVPAIFMYSRMRLMKLWYMLWGLFYALTSSWIVNYFAGGGEFSHSAMVYYQQRTACVSSYVFWDTYSIAGAIFSVIYGGFLIYTGISFDDNRVKVRRNVIIVLTLRILLPMLNNLIVQHRIFSVFWLANNYADIISLIFMTAAIIAASVKDSSWIELIWDAPGVDVITEDEDN